MFYFLLFVSLAFAVARCVLPAQGIRTDDLFKDAAHGYVFLLFGAGIAWSVTARRMRRDLNTYFRTEAEMPTRVLLSLTHRRTAAIEAAKTCWFFGGALTLVEIVAFLVR